MRPNHQNKRMRGRNRGSGGGGGGGKGPNPLTRSYESNGPDVKVRGTAQSIAEKYVQLGRDAQASGDHVQAESFFQHAEHYYRLIAAAQEQFRLQNPGFRGFDQPEGDDEGGDEEPFGHSQPQPDVQPNFASGEMGEGGEQSQDYQPREQREYRDNRDQRDNRDFNNRGPRPQRDNRNFQPRDNRNFQPREQREPREGQFAGQPGEQPGFEPREDRRPPREHQPREQQPRENQPREHQPRDNQRFERGPRRFDREQPAVGETEQPDLPSFITAPSRTPVIPTESEAGLPVEPNLGEPVGIRRRGRPPRVRPIEDTPVGE